MRYYDPKVTNGWTFDLTVDHRGHIVRTDVYGA